MIHSFIIKKLFLLSLFILPFVLNAQIKDKFNFDSTYIKRLERGLILRINGGLKSNEVNIIDRETKREIIYKPNESFNIGLGFNFRGFGFNFSFIHSIAEDFLKTTRFDFQPTLNTRRLEIDLKVQTYKGYFIENPETYLPNWTGEDDNPVRKDVSTFSILLSSFYAFNFRKFSYKAAFSFSEIQKKSAGSFIMGPYFSLYGIEADSVIYPNELIPQTTNPKVIFNQSSFLTVGINTGYIHTFVIQKKFFVTSALSIGLGPEIGFSSLDKKEVEGAFRLAVKYNFRLAMGYNNNKVYTGLILLADSLGNGGDGNTWMTYDVSKFKIFIGRRFHLKRRKK